MTPSDFADRRPLLRLEEYFAGVTKGWGLFQDRTGRVRRQFELEINGVWDGALLTLEESFVYDDGEREERAWRVRPTGEHGYQADADDLIGEAIGEARGNALNWTYLFALNAGGRRWRVRFDEWFFLMEDGVVINRAKVSKFGILVGETTIAFQRQDVGASARADAPALAEALARRETEPA